jgi:hypothetical protein
MTSIRRLPRSLDPLPDESLPGYLLRLSHRLELSPLRLGRATGLALPNAGIPASCMLALRPDTIERFARATRLSTAETTSLTLASLSSRYPPVNTGFSFSGQRKQQRNVEGVFVKENWILSRSSRYCPHCPATTTSTQRPAPHTLPKPSHRGRSHPACVTTFSRCQPANQPSHP